MIPLRDTARSGSFPYVTILIVIINVLVFLGEISLTDLGLTQLFYTFGVVPHWIIENFNQGRYLSVFIPMITSTFLHGGWLHIISNMLFLWVFGDNIEDRVGHLRFFVLYLLLGLIANIAQVMSNPQSTVPIIGASGAVAGILGAYYLTFPRSRILALVPILFFITFIEVKASFFIFFWFVLQIFNGVLSLGVVGNSVAWWAHIGGFIGGMLLTWLFIKRTDKNYL